MNAKGCTVFLLMLLTIGCSNFPRDPEHSFEKAKADGLLVGLVANPPYVIEENGRFSGIEIQLLEDFADKHDMNIRYEKGSESQLIDRLEKYELHITAGGFSKKTIWISKAGLSKSYDQNHVLLVPKGENQLLYFLDQHILKVR